MDKCLLCATHRNRAPRDARYTVALTGTPKPKPCCSECLGFEQASGRACSWWRIEDQKPPWWVRVLSFLGTILGSTLILAAIIGVFYTTCASPPMS